jgi:hypothetical protein
VHAYYHCIQVGRNFLWKPTLAGGQNSGGSQATVSGLKYFVIGAGYLSTTAVQG